MQGYQINSVSAPPNTVDNQVVPPTGTGGWGRDCAPGITGTKIGADESNDLLGNVLRVLQAARVSPTANRYDDLLDALNIMYRGPSSDEGNALSAGSDGKPYVALAWLLQTIRAVIDEMDRFLSKVDFNPDTHEMTFQVEGGETFVVDLSGLIPINAGTAFSGDGSAAEPLQLRFDPNGGVILTADGVAIRSPVSVGNLLTVDAQGARVVLESLFGEDPIKSTGTEIPTTAYGGRDAFLGEPAGWADIGGGRKVPFYV
ncbi:hypothetical protein [Paraburkholderia tuberum]|uniref:Uncharacterized protein n=1 Tax=Paraburkholderia tuberum TaxID=157910 RepID=A0A1H1JST3_9BURK|nr:hypothetical protein [Paraburkholderia tuberum]SDR52972.1 hypothetical protein SAMN05445850_5583 [Paraburkholderia tuberum]